MYTTAMAYIIMDNSFCVPEPVVGDVALYRKQSLL